MFGAVQDREPVWHSSKYGKDQSGRYEPHCSTLNICFDYPWNAYVWSHIWVTRNGSIVKYKGKGKKEDDDKEMYEVTLQLEEFLEMKLKF